MLIQEEIHVWKKRTVRREEGEEGLALQASAENRNSRVSRHELKAMP